MEQKQKDLVLVVDSDLEAVRDLEAILLAEGYEVVTTTVADQVISMALAERPQAAILDNQIPNGSGQELLAEFRQNAALSRIPVMMLSANANAEERIQGLKAGAQDFLAKPYVPEELLLRLGNMLGRIRRLQEEDAGLGLDSERYDIWEVLGFGGMGVVFRGWDNRLGREVAIKTLRPEVISGQEGIPKRELIESLLHEAVTVAKLSHPNIIAVYDAENRGDTAWMILEIVDGPSLDRYFEQSPSLSVPAAVHLVAEVAEGLAAAHAKGILHQDIKPQNILLGLDGVVKVADFGLARWRQAAFGRPARAMGTPGFLAPEWIANEVYTETSDLFALGVLLFRCLTGYIPFQGNTDLEIMLSTVSEDPLPLPEEIDNPLGLTLILDSLLKKDPLLRPQSAREVANDLRELAEIGGWKRKGWTYPWVRSPSQD